MFVSIVRDGEMKSGLNEGNGLNNEGTVLCYLV